MQDNAFRLYYIDRKLPVARAAVGVGVALVIAICVMDMLLLPAAFAEKAIPIRIWTMLIPMLAVLGATFLVKKRILLPYMVAFVACTTGISAVAIGVVAAQSGVATAYWGLIFTTFSIYIVLGLNLRQSVAAGWTIFVVYFSAGVLLGLPTEKLAYGAVFLGLSNLAGTYASFMLERNAREIFENRQALKHLARTDGLTGLNNRRTFDEHVGKTWRQARREECRIAIVIADIDHFKLYNDCYGHQKGDECIKLVALALEDMASRPLDLVARYGGEEFAMVLYDPTPSYLESLTRSLCHKVVDLDIEHKASEATPTVSLSVGAAITEATGSTTPEQLLRQADDALYEAKNQGRNQAIVYRTEWGQQTTSHLAAVLL